jgi:hypothetical protein
MKRSRLVKSTVAATLAASLIFTGTTVARTHAQAEESEPSILDGIFGHDDSSQRPLENASHSYKSEQEEENSEAEVSSESDKDTVENENTEAENENAATESENADAENETAAAAEDEESDETDEVNDVQYNTQTVEVFIKPDSSVSKGDSIGKFYYAGTTTILVPEGVNLNDLAVNSSITAGSADANGVDLGIDIDGTSSGSSCQGTHSWTLDGAVEDFVGHDHVTAYVTWTNLKDEHGSWHLNGTIHYSINQYNVTFKNDASDEGTKQLVTYNEKVTAPEEDPTAQGKRFVGWAKEDGTLFDFENEVITGDITLTAVFEGDGTDNNPGNGDNGNNNTPNNTPAPDNGNSNNTPNNTPAPDNGNSNNTPNNTPAPDNGNNNNTPNNTPAPDNGNNNNTPAETTPAETTPAPDNTQQTTPAETTTTPAEPVTAPTNGNNNGNNNNTPAANDNAAANNTPAANDNAAANNTPAAVVATADDTDAADNTAAGEVTIADEGTPLADGTDEGTADTTDEVTIADEDTPLASGTDEEVTDNEVEINDEETPLAAAEDNCIIHWIIFLLTLIAGIYNLVRAYVRSRKDNEEEEETAQEA